MTQRSLFLSTGLVLLGSFIVGFGSIRQKQKTIGRNFPPSSADTTIPDLGIAKDHKGKIITSQKGVIHFSSGLHNDYYQIDTIKRTGYLYLETKLDKFINENGAKTPLNLSIVIDRSGSMSGDKLAYAKKAARDIIHKLSEDDFVSIVVYDDNVKLLQSSTRVLDKESILTKINRIETGGSTNLWGGTEMGYHQVKETYKKNYVNRVLLISDGLANVGLTSMYEIRRKVQEFKDRDGITVSTFGVGLDYNELLMTDMAEAGSGNYYFIDNPENMAGIFEKELNGLMSVAAQNAELRIRLPRGIKVDKAFAFKYEQVNQELVIQLRDLFSEETRGFLMRFSIDDYANVALDFTCRLSYDDVSTRERMTMENRNRLNPSNDRELYLTYFNEPVMQQIVLFVTNEKMEIAMLEADKGNYDQARKLVKDNEEFLIVNSGYASKSVEIQKMKSVNESYSNQLKEVETMSADSVKYMQKSSRSTNYKIRGKKGN